MNSLESLPTFSRENYHEDFPHGARFMLFQGPDKNGYLRISQRAKDRHEDIVTRFLEEVREKVSECLDGFVPMGGGFYTFYDYDRRTGDPLPGKPKVEFKGQSADRGRFNSKLLGTILQKGQPPVDWIINKK